MKKIAFLNLLAATGFLKKSWEGQQKAGKVSGNKKKQLEEHFVTN